MAARSLDIRIVGGGFAGCVTALTLLNGDHAVDCNVTVYEREPRAHTTLCGEGLSDDTLRAFTAFDSKPYIAESFEGASWWFPGGVEFRIHQRGHTMARERWIPAMADEIERLGGTYVTGQKVTAELVPQLAREADLVVGADGPGSVVRKHVGGSHETMLGIQYRMAREGRVPERLEFYTDKRWSPEYAWAFPRGDIMNVGLLAAGDGHDWERLDAFCKDKQLSGKLLKREAYPIGFFGDKLQQGNVVLIGDAAGLTNPITKGGMSAVVHASNVLAGCAREGVLAEYEQRVFAHPMCDRSFAPALRALRRWTNADFARLLRYAPRPVEVAEDGSTQRQYVGRLLATLALNPLEVPAMLAVARAMGTSKRWSW